MNDTAIQQALYCFVGVFETQYPAYSFVNKGCLKINGRFVIFIIYTFFFLEGPLARPYLYNCVFAKEKPFYGGTERLCDVVLFVSLLNGSFSKDTTSEICAMHCNVSKMLPQRCCLGSKDFSIKLTENVFVLF